MDGGKLILSKTVKGLYIVLDRHGDVIGHVRRRVERERVLSGRGGFPSTWWRERVTWDAGFGIYISRKEAVKAIVNRQTYGSL